MSSIEKPPQKRENLILSIIFNLIIPFLILSKLSGEDHLGPVVALIVGLAFPLAYGIYDLFDRRQVNFVSVLGLISVGLSGGFGIAKLDPMWLAVKEASIPAVIGTLVFLSFKSKKPLIKTFLYNPQVINTVKIDAALDSPEKQNAFEKRFERCNWMLVASFILSAVLNFLLARWIVTTPPSVDMVAFNAELGKMNLVSWPVIVIPSMAIMMYALFYLMSGIHKLTGLEWDAMFNEPPKKEKKPRA